MLNTLRYCWNVTRGYRLRPWKSPYVRWRFETFLGGEAEKLDAAKFFRLSWKYRANFMRFMGWTAKRKEAQGQVERQGGEPGQ